MAKTFKSNYLNGSRNIVHLSGFVRRVADDLILVAQSANEAQHIPVRVRPSRTPIRPNLVYSIRAQLRARRDGNRHHIEIVATQGIRRASLTEAPEKVARLQSLAQNFKVAAGTDPFAMDELRSRLVDAMGQKGFSDQAIEAMLAANSRFGAAERFANHVIVSGFVGHKAFYPSEDGRGGHVQFLLAQHPDPALALPVRVGRADPKLVRTLGAMLPVNTIGTLRMESGEEEGVRHVVLESRADAVGGALPTDFEHGEYPAWWKDAVNAFYAQRKAVSKPAPQEAPVADAPVAPAEDRAVSPARAAGLL